MAWKELFLGICIVTLLIGSQVTLAAPYWVGKGAVIEYVAYRDNAYINGLLRRGLPPESVTTVNMYYLQNGSGYTIRAYNTSYLKFEIIESSQEYFKVKVELMLSNVTVITNATSPKFWTAGEVITHTCKKGACLYRLRTLEITGFYKILKRGDQVVAKGKAYGKTFLWIEPTQPLKNGTVLFDADGTLLKVARVETIDESFKTYNGTFGPPLVKVYTNKISINTGSISAEGINVYLYDGSDFLLLSWFGLAGIPDLRAIGVVAISLIDQRAGSEGIHTLGPTLYRFTPSPQTSGSQKEQNSYSISSTDTDYTKAIFYTTLIIVLGVLLARLRK